jgi:hypothetical protein
MKPSLADIKSTIDALAGKINAPQHLLPTYSQSVDGAHPHIEIDKNGQLYLVIVERGQELRRDLAVDMNDLLYRVFVGVTLSLACDYEAGHRIANQDFRRLMFFKQEELLGILNAEWKLRMQKEHQWVLRGYPFDDNSDIRTEYSKRLTNNGIPASEAWTIACKKYPLPKTDQ